MAHGWEVTQRSSHSRMLSARLQRASPGRGQLLYFGWCVLQAASLWQGTPEIPGQLEAELLLWFLKPDESPLHMSSQNALGGDKTLTPLLLHQVQLNEAQSSMDMMLCV